MLKWRPRSPASRAVHQWVPGWLKFVLALFVAHKTTRRRPPSMRIGAWLTGETHAKPERVKGVQDPGASVLLHLEAPGQPAEESHQLHVALSRELTWWFPSALVLVSAITVALFYVANRYYLAFYAAFGLDQVQAGVSRTDTAIRLLPLGVAIALFAGFARLVWVLGRVASGSPSRRKETGTTRPAEKGFLAGIWNTKATIVVLLGLAATAVLLVGDIGTAASHAGRRDAKMVISSTDNYLYSSWWQERLGTKTLIDEVRWLGPPEETVIPTKLPNGTSTKGVSAGRLVAQYGETTVYFDLISCEVHSVPTIDVSFSHLTALRS